MSADEAQAPTAPRVALIGSPNSGKTTLFNALTGLRRRVANYPGVTVEHAIGTAEGRTGAEVTLVDLPGTYSLEPLSVDESVTTQVLAGELGEEPMPDGIIVVADATTLRRSMQLVLEVLARGLPAVVVLTMLDELKARGGAVRLGAMRKALGVPVVGIVGNKGIGLDDVRELLDTVHDWATTGLDVPSGVGVEAVQERYSIGDELLDALLTEPNNEPTASDKVDNILLHPVAGIAVFVAVMFGFFQAIFVLAAPVQDLFEGVVLALGELMRAIIPDGLLESLVVDGVIAGVGGVVVFVPQIAILLLLLRFLESCGYMARAAFLIDRVMGWAGLEGRSFVALLSSYACAVPGVMAARTIPDPRSRLATILVAPLMTCSARLPVYALLISAFVPRKTVAGVSLQGLTMFGLYAFGSLSAFLAAAAIQRVFKKKAQFPFYMELPPYRLPTTRSVLRSAWMGVRAFLKKAGTVILAASIVLWGLLTFPQTTPPDDVLAAAESVEEAEAISSAWALEHSAGGAIGRGFEPVIAPLGYDWRIGVGILGSFAAREVIVATLAQVFAHDGGDEDLEGLGGRIAAAEAPDGSPAYSLATAVSLLVFFVFSLQCVSTLAVMRRETGGWKWPAIAFGYMLVLAYVGAFVAYRVTLALTGTA